MLNGLVLVSFARQLEERGTPPREAIAQAAELRLRPVLMTALVAALGFVPMALSHAPGSEVQRPLATVVIGGLVTATVLTLLLFPAVYALAHRAGERNPCPKTPPPGPEGCPRLPTSPRFAGRGGKNEQVGDLLFDRVYVCHDRANRRGHL